MQDHEIEVDRSNEPAIIRFADTFNIASFFLDRHLRQGRAEKIAAMWRDCSLSYGQMAEAVMRCGSMLRGLGVQPGERVMLFVKDRPAFYTAFLGAARIGAVAVPVNTFLRSADYAYMLQDSGARVVFASDDALAELLPALEQPGHAVGHRIACDTAREGWLQLDAALSSASPECPPQPTTPASPCFWLYSSGSTGSPKASVHEHKDMVYTAELFATAIAGLREDDLIFSAPKLFFAYGLNNSLAFPLYAGASCALLEDRPTGTNTLDMINRFQPSIYFGVPTLYAAQLAAIEKGHAVRTGPLRFCHSGGEALPAAILERWRAATGLEIYDGIGSSEVLHIYTSNRPGEVRPGSAGRAVPGYELRVADENGNEQPDGVPGELWIRGGSVAKYYWNKPEKSASAWRDGWFRSGDTVYRDSEGAFHFCGRDDDMLKVGGIWVAPFEIESALASHPAVLEVAVVGAPDEQNLIKPKAYCVLRDGHVAGDALAQELIAFVKTRLAPYKYPRWVTFLPELPKTASGKIQRFRLRQQA